MLKAALLAAALSMEATLAWNNDNNNNNNNNNPPPVCTPVPAPQHKPKNPAHHQKCPPEWHDPQRNIMQLFDYGFPRVSCWEFPTFCQLMEWAPSVRSLWGIGDGWTVLVPTEYAWNELQYNFPAFFAWVRALPDCYRFNRLEYILQLHSSPLKNLTCPFVDEIPGKLVTVPSFARGEWLTFAKNITAKTNTSSFVVDTSCFFDYVNSPTVQWVATGYNGNVQVINQVLQPANNPLAIFPSQYTLTYIAEHPHLNIFYALLIHTGVADYIWSTYSFATVFAPVDSAFAGVSISYLFAPQNLETVRRWVLDHFVAGYRDGVYLHLCPIYKNNNNMGNTTLLMEGGDYITFTGTQQSLQLRYGVYNATGPEQASTIAPFTDEEFLDGILHKISGFLMPVPGGAKASPSPSVAPPPVQPIWDNSLFGGRMLAAGETAGGVSSGALHRRAAAASNVLLSKPSFRGDPALLEGASANAINVAALERRALQAKLEGSFAARHAGAARDFPAAAASAEGKPYVWKTANLEL